MKVIALSRIKHNRVVYEEGQEINGLTDIELARLEEAKVVEVKQDVPEKKVERKEAKKVVEVKQKEKAPKEVEQETATEVANIKPTKEMSKQKLIGIGRARGLEIDKTVSPEEAFAVVSKDFEERGEIEVTASEK